MTEQSVSSVLITDGDGTIVFNRRASNAEKFTAQPGLKVIENKRRYILEVLLPGLKINNITLDVDKENRLLKLKEEKKQVMKSSSYGAPAHTYDEGILLEAEEYIITTSRNFLLPLLADLKQVKATLKDGVLFVYISKIKPGPKPVRAPTRVIAGGSEETFELNKKPQGGSTVAEEAVMPIDASSASS